MKDLVTVAKEVTGEEGIFPDVAAQHLRDAWSKMEEKLDDVTITWEARCLDLEEENVRMKIQLQVDSFNKLNYISS